MTKGKLITINLAMPLLKEVGVVDFKDLEASTVHLSQIFLKIFSVMIFSDPLVALEEDHQIEEMI